MSSSYALKTGLDSGSLTAAKTATKHLFLSLEFTIEIMPIMTYTGVVFSFMGSLSINRHHFYLLMILKEKLTFRSLRNSVPQ